MTTWTSLKLIQWTTGYFEKKGIPNPRLDAELLLSYVLKCPRLDLYTQFEKIVSEKDREKFKSFVERRATREPLQYILGETEFWGLKIKVTPDVLIPRPETELLVEEAIHKIKGEGGKLDDSFRRPASQQPSKDKRVENADNGQAAIERGQLSVSDNLPPSPLILDIGTGSGCIAIALAKHLPHAHILATDISQEALAVAQKNVDSHELQGRIKLILANIAPWKSFQAEGRLFDLIVSNPPYIKKEEIRSLQAEVQREPHQALDGGPQGLSCLETILNEAPTFLKSGGFLLLEVGENQADLLKEKWEMRTKKDLAGIERFVIFQKK